MKCKNCGSEIKEGNTFCTNCGHSINEPNRSSSIIITLVVITIIVVIAIIGFIRLNQVSNNRNDMKQGLEEQIQNKSTQMNNIENIPKEIDIKLYDINNFETSKITLDNTSESGAVYNFSKEDFKLVIENVCKENNVKYEESSSNNKEYYGFIIDLNNNKTLEVFIMIQNSKITGIGISGLPIEKSSTNEIQDKIFTNIIKKLFEEEYVEQIIKTESELGYSEYRIANKTVYMKMNFSTLMLTQLEVEEWNLIKEQIDTDIYFFMIIPASQEKYKEIKENMSLEKVVLSENVQGTMFKHTESISYIKFTSNTEFEMMLGVEGSEGFTKSGTYTRNGNEIILNVTYDSELEPSEYTGITEPFKSYKTKIEIIDSNTLKYTDEKYTYLFKNNYI